MPRYRSATPRATDRKLLNTTADILAVVPGEGSSVSTMPITRSRTVKPVPALISADADVESSVMVFLNDVHRYRVSCNFCPVLTRRSLLTGSLLAADAATRHDQPDRNLTGGQRLRRGTPEPHVPRPRTWGGCVKKRLARAKLRNVCWRATLLYMLFIHTHSLVA